LVSPIFWKKLEEAKFQKNVAKQHQNRMEELKNILEDLLPTFWWKMASSGRIAQFINCGALASSLFISLLLFSSSLNIVTKYDIKIME